MLNKIINNYLFVSSYILFMLFIKHLHYELNLKHSVLSEHVMNLILNTKGDKLSERLPTCYNIM